MKFLLSKIILSIDLSGPATTAPKYFEIRLMTIATFINILETQTQNIDKFNNVCVKLTKDLESGNSRFDENGVHCSSLNALCQLFTYLFLALHPEEAIGIKKDNPLLDLAPEHLEHRLLVLY